MLLDDAAREFPRTRSADPLGRSTGFGEGAVRTYSTGAEFVRTGPYIRRNVTVKLIPRGAGKQSREDDAKRKNGGAVSDGISGVLGNAFFGPTVLDVDWDDRELHFIPTGG